MPLPPRRGFPLTALFLLVTVCAVTMALIRASQPNVDGGDREGAAVFCGMIGLVIGIISGFSQPQPIRAAILGGIGGALSGAAAGVLLVAPPEFPVAAGACGILLLAGLAMRWLS